MLIHIHVFSLSQLFLFELSLVSLSSSCSTDPVAQPVQHVQLLVQPKAERNLEQWIDKTKSDPPFVNMEIQMSESLPPGSNASWPTCKTLNSLRSGVDRTKANLIKWGYHTGDPSCNCGKETQTIEHLLQCPLLKTPCSRNDLVFLTTPHRNA